MKKFITAAVVSVAILAGTMPAHADNSENVIIGILGGALGGLIVGEALGNNRPYYQPPAYYQPPVVYAPPPVYYQQQVVPYPVYEEQIAPVQCVYKKKKIYDPNINEYVFVKKKVCY